MPSDVRSVAVPGGHLHVVVDGDGPPVLLVHAGIVDSRAWDPLVPYLVTAGFRVIRYDVRGYGRSATDDIEFSNRADLLAVLDGVGVDRAVLVGNSRGATICLDTALETPERAIALGWVGGGISGFDGRATPEEIEIFDQADALEAAADVEALADLEARIWVDGILQPAGRAPAWIRDAVREMDRPLLEPGRAMGRPIPLDPPANDRLGELHIPVLAVAGALDTTSTIAAAARLEAAVPGTKRMIIPGVAHMVGMEVPEQLAGLIVELIRPLGSWA